MLMIQTACSVTLLLREPSSAAVQSHSVDNWAICLWLMTQRASSVTACIRSLQQLCLLIALATVVWDHHLWTSLPTPAGFRKTLIWHSHSLCSLPSLREYKCMTLTTMTITWKQHKIKKNMRGRTDECADQPCMSAVVLMLGDSSCQALQHIPGHDCYLINDCITYSHFPGTQPFP